MQDVWIVCPHCGHKWRDAFSENPVETNPRRVGWYPNKRQWWVIWIAAILIVIGLMVGYESDGKWTFAFCVVLISSLLVWKLQ